MNNYDCIIIGGGIAGITASIYLKNANKNILLIEKSSMGGTLNKISEIHNYPGFSSISGPDLASNLYSQIKSLEVPILNDTVIKIEHQETKNIVYLKDKKLECKYLILATGKEARKLGLPLEDDLIGKGVSYCALCDGGFFKDKDVAVIGAGEAALNEALYLSNICHKVIIVNKYNEFKTETDILDKLKKKGNVLVLYNSLTTALKSKNSKLSSIIVKDEKEEQELEVSGIFVYIGSTPNIFSNLDFELDGKYLKVRENFETSVDSIYAIGDVITKKYYQLVNAASEGMEAAMDIIKRLNKE